MLDISLQNRINKICVDNRPLDADGLFQDLTVVPGRVWILPSGVSISPYERLKQYESRLLDIYIWDKQKYYFIHKGTPFYYCGVLSFDIGVYDRAIFYFDAGLSEDFKNKIDWKTNCAAYHFYILDESYSNPVVQYPVGLVKTVLDPLIKEFNTYFSGKKARLELVDFIKNFVDGKMKEDEYRSVIPALYLFIVESEQRLFQLKIRSDYGGTIEPFIIHLLKGCLIFETLLKLVYPSHSSSELGFILKDPFIKEDLKYCKNPKTSNKDLIDYVAGVRKTLQDIVIHMSPYLEKHSYVTDQWLTTTYALRNVTTHNLSWPDCFDSNNYEKLFKSVLFSIFYLISNKF